MTLFFRYNCVPISSSKVSVTVSIFPRSLQRLTEMCGEQNISLGSPEIPVVNLCPANKQALVAR